MVTFINTHPTETARCTFYADYLAMDFNKAKNFAENMFSDFVEDVLREMGVIE